MIEISSVVTPDGESELFTLLLRERNLSKASWFFLQFHRLRGTATDNRPAPE